MEIGRSELGKLTFGKGTVNTAIRWLPFFLPTLAVAFDSSTATLALMLGIAEASGLSTIFVGRWLDAGRERLVMMASLAGVAISSGLALVGTTWFFGAAAVVLGVSAGHITVGGHAWIASRVAFDRRARFIGVFEISWASALLVGVPIVAALISAFGWRAPFIAVAVAAAAAALLIATIDDGDQDEHGRKPAVASSRDHAPITADAWLVIGAAATIAMAGLAMIVVTGTWLDEALGVSTGGVGLVAIAFGLAELLASTASSAFADRFGKRRSMLFSVTATLAGLVIISLAGSSLLLATIGLCVFFVGFEYSIVTSFSLVSEAMPAARGRALAVGNGASTVARGVGVSASGFLYEAFAIEGPVLLSIVGASTTFVLLVLVGRRRPDLR